MEKMSRRSFLKAGTAATAALAMTPTEMLAKAKNTKKKAGKMATTSLWMVILLLQVLTF